jgi:hypothetical protein
LAYLTFWETLLRNEPFFSHDSTNVILTAQPNAKTKSINGATPFLFLSGILGLVKIKLDNV